MQRSARIRQEGDRVILLDERGRAVLDLPWEAAVDVGRAMIAKGRQAEEYAKANLIIMDHAILFRAGFPLGLTNRADMLKEAVKTARDDRNLRRYMPGGIKSESIVGTPTLIQKEPVINGS